MKSGVLNFWNPQGLSRLVQELLYLLCVFSENMVISRSSVIAVMDIPLCYISACTEIHCLGILKAFFLLKIIQHTSLAYTLNTPGKFIER
jgi:hypothetical protein